jgi:pilus assembly protein CpaF
MNNKPQEPLFTPQDSEDYYYYIRLYVFSEMSPAEILREKSHSPEHIKDEIRAIALKGIQESKRVLPSEYQDQLISRLINEIFGFGIIQPLLDDNNVTEIMIVSPEQVYIEQNGKLILTDLKFESTAQIIQIIDRIVSPLGRRIDESSPLVDARLPDGSRINAVIPPIAVKSPTLTVRKFKDTILDYQSLIQFGSMTEEMAKMIDHFVKSRLNILISGGTGSGKTTLLNVCSSSIPADERIITIEDSIELKLKQPHVVSLEGKPPNIEGQGQITIRDLVINSLRMRPDRIVVGEVRGPEAFDMLQAMNTGHDGSLSTIHANSPRDVISRLISMIYMAGIDMPVNVIREMIFSSIECIIQTVRLSDGTRRVQSISECMAFDGQDIKLHDIYRLNITGIDKQGRAQGNYIFEPYGERINQKVQHSVNITDAQTDLSVDKTKSIEDIIQQLKNKPEKG